jgi:hydantoinase/carbamoylase family amidase
VPSKLLSTSIEASATRIARDVEVLSGPDYTTSDEAIRRYAYTDAYKRTVSYFEDALSSLDFEVAHDPVGNFVARNRPRGEPVFGIGSHCDSNRNGGRYDGTLGVVSALELCRLNAEDDLGLPVQLISWLEEEGSGFGEMLLGSRIAAGRVTDAALEAMHSVDNGVPFMDEARAAGFEPERWRESRQILDDLVGWIEIHIEQGRVLQDAEIQIGLVTAISGVIHADLVITGRADHAGATPMTGRVDAGAVAAETVYAVERFAREAGDGTVGTVGQVTLEPGLRNVVPGRATVALDIRSVDESKLASVFQSAVSHARAAAEARGAAIEVVEHQDQAPTPMDTDLVDALAVAAERLQVPTMRIASGAAHDTMLVAPRIPSAMIFVPCKDGISHSPAEEARPVDAAVAARFALETIFDRFNIDTTATPR